MTNNKNNTLAFLIGAAVGGATALLLAPESGTETRRRLSEGARNMKSKAKDKAESISYAVKGAVSDAKSTYREQLDKRHETEIDFARGRVRSGGQAPGLQSPNSQS